MSTAAMLRAVPVTDTLFPGFELFDIDVPGTTIRARIGGEGPPLLLLHGHPQTHAMWHAVAARLKDRFTLVCADLRGYGDSGKPETTPDHAPYSKRAMAADMVSLMSTLGHERFFIGSHDRGARVAHRLALDHPERVLRLVTLDIAPTREMFRNTNEAFARSYWHWFFLSRPAPLPEMMIGADPERYWLTRSGGGPESLAIFAEEALAHYLRCFRDPRMIHAACEDYRAAAGIDIAHDDADGGRLMETPLLALWGGKAALARCFDVLDLWRQRASDVRGHALPGGHYLAEEVPDLVAAEFAAFFGESP